MKVNKIPYSDNYYLTQDCRIYKECEDIENAVQRVHEIVSGLYKISFHGSTVNATIVQLIALTKYGYCDWNKFEIRFNYENMYESTEYIITSVFPENDHSIIVNGELFMRSPRWAHLYSNRYGVVYDINHNRFRKVKQDKDGYIRFTPVKEFSNYAIHRFVYECWSQQILSSDLVIHHKNSDKSYNYFENLELTTPAQNSRYSIINNERKLIRSFNIEDIHEMCRMMQDGKTYREIALKFNVDSNNESEYKTFRSRLNLLLQKKISWVDISSQYDFTGYIGNWDPSKKYSSEDILEMHQMHSCGISQKDIAEKFGTNQKYVQAVLSGRKRRTEYELFEKGSTTIENVA